MSENLPGVTYTLFVLLSPAANVLKPQNIRVHFLS